MKAFKYILAGDLNFSNLNKRHQSINCIKTISFCILLLATVTFARNMSEENSQLQSVLQGNGVFTKNLYNILAKSDGNIFFSPISIHAILALTSQGSDGETKEALLKTLSVPSNEISAEGYKSVMDRLNNVEDVALYMANKVYIKESYSLKQDFKTAITKYFYSEIQSVNFTDSPQAAQTINSWVEKKTNQKIKSLIGEEDLDDSTRLVLVNAIYFKGKWAQPFDAEETTTEKFYVNDNDSIDVQMMHVKKKFYYKQDETLDAKVLEMPYTNKDVSMIIILPNKRNGIVELEEKLSKVDLTKITANMHRPEVIVSLPKFKIETTMELTEPLKEMGLNSIFSENANFSEMLDSAEPICVSKVIQKAFIEVNEEGAEAAAATGMVMAMRCLMIAEDFVADHPFIVALVTNTTDTLDTVLFTGRISNPTA